MQNREHGRMILESVEHGPLIWPTIEENGVTRTKKYVELSTAKKTQADCDMKATNIILQGLVVPVFSSGYDPIACLNKEMTFLTAVASLRHMARQCTQPKRPRNAAWYKDKAMLAEAQEEKANKEQNNELVTIELERYKERVKTFEQRLNINLSSHEKMIDSQMDDMIKEKLALKEQVDTLEQNLSKQIKEKESLLQTFTIFKNEFKEKENKYMENEIDLEKKIKELDNIIFKVGQSA
ncbi:hypothetical protein Tco_0519574 [Tanacetum coccineum]